MDRCVVYQMLGASYKLQTALSLFALRKHYQGNVVLVTDVRDELRPIFGRQCELQDVKPLTSKTPWYDEKPGLLLRTIAKSNVYFDCDTLITGDITSLFPEPSDDRITLTQCTDWTARSLQANFRLEAASDRGLLHPSWVAATHKANLPAVNSGVFAWSESCKLGEEWQTLTRAMPFLADEQVLNLMTPQWPHRVFDDRWNHSPQWSLVRLEADVKVWHYTSGYIGRGRDLYYRVLAEALDANFCNITDWYGKDTRFVRERK